MAYVPGTKLADARDALTSGSVRASGCVCVCVHACVYVCIMCLVCVGGKGGVGRDRLLVFEFWRTLLAGTLTPA